MTKLSYLSLALAIVSASAFAPLSSSPVSRRAALSPPISRLYEDKKDATEAVFVPPTEEDSEASADDIPLEAAESLGRGAAKAKRGKRKSGTSASSSKAKNKSAATLAPEQVFYEGPPAITETIAPTISILTVVGIIPAAAAWARQAWVRYKITTRRIRVTSGIGGNEMAEIVYPDIVELRTAKRLFGDGDLVAFLRDGAKFEMRNIPNFDDTMDFILKQVDKEVADEYRARQGKVE
mmetsp:Transcript_14702/g.26604  ORF Transcript_14702/g.26604 Transcript_14702/m.26604 type:complete len:237 (-) Transcript_14702:54-764(-)|eukprot:CAMPEP_0202492320 /NCGR_PEP_ID=MMETSP1361-20130828/9077_1 /ASSEMBLY_ACC=CAM_ASM_000849 /TAXON_ID=210615 /ORGANISM="Staurosira complex sp., Strain CCMP2646" /LENGTH=236 /DNA_ID=CAMNT_0049122509 /DNA_START=101 /DNA_END=811 /DNA_ORIENTATION=-